MIIYDYYNLVIALMVNLHRWLDCVCVRVCVVLLFVSVCVRMCVGVKGGLGE